MASHDEEDERLRAVGMQNARSIQQARQLAEEDLVRAKRALELRGQELSSSLAMMRATLEATTDSILVTDSVGRVTGFNEKFLTLWRLPAGIMTGAHHRDLVRLISQQLSNPAAFQARIEEIYASSAPEAFTLLELIDGRVIEQFSRIQLIDGRVVGRVWSLRDVTSHRRAEAQLRKQAEWQRITLASIGDGVITTDTEGRVISLNRVAETLTGWPLAEARGMPLELLFQIVQEQTRQPIANPAIRALRENRMVALTDHSILIARDGTQRAIDDSAAPIRDEDGQVLGVVLIFRDVSGRRRAEEAGLHLAAVVDSSDDAIITKSLDGIIDTWNQGAQRIFGYTAAEVIGRPITIILPVDRLHEEEAILARLRRGDRLDHFETIRVHKDGHPIDVSVTSSPVRDADGRIIGASKIARDITQRKRAERTTRFLAEASAALAELGDWEDMLRRLARLAVPGFADLCAVDVLNADGTVRRVTLICSDALDPDLCQELARRFHPEQADLHGVAQVLRSGEATWIESLTHEDLTRLARGDEHLAILHQLGLRSYLSIPLVSRSRILGALTFLTAKSGRYYGATDLAAAEDLADRTVIAMDNSALVAALQSSDQRKDEFLAMLAHELRNPLAPIRNAVQILHAKAPAVPELRWAAEVIDRQVVQMTRLVDDLLDVSRITSGKIQLRKERLDLATVLQSAVDASRPLIEQAGHALTITLPPEPVRLEGDLTRLSQLFLNLLNNAAKYTDPRGEIWLTAERQDHEIQVSVRDNGIGIAPEMLPRIFEMFAQVDDAVERSQGGLGIGLMLVRRLAELHGGSVEARSGGRGQGSEFVVRLPLSDAASPAGSQPPASEVRSAGPPRRILVVDDNRDSADSLAMLLGMYGHEVSTAHDAAAGIKAAGEFRPEVVLLDIGLPGSNGYEAARRIRAMMGREVVLIAMTGWGQDADRRRSAEAGFDHHLIKPVEAPALLRLLEDRVA